MEFLLSLNIHQYRVVYIVWNLILALTPCLTVYFMLKAKRSKYAKFAFGPLFLFWLFMLPNTAYLFFIVRHLVDYCNNLGVDRVCMDGSSIPLFFFVYSAMGIPTFYYAISRMMKHMKKQFRSPYIKHLPFFVIPLTSMGLMFGLYDRYNSWDILRKPLLLIESAWSYLTTPVLLWDFIFFTLALFFIYYFTAYLVKND